MRTFIAVLLIAQITCPAFAAPEQEKEITLRAYDVPGPAGGTINSYAMLEVIQAFRARFPHIKPITERGLTIPGRSMDVMPLMKIAGDVASDTLYVNFRQSDTYVRSKFLYPLDKYIGDLAGQSLPGAHLLNLDDFLAKLRETPHYKEAIEDRVPLQCWKVMRRLCPYQETCPYLLKWGEKTAENHYHTWCFPIGPIVTALFYRWDHFNEAGLPDRAPETFDELLAWSRKLHNPAEKRYGLMMRQEELSYSTLTFLYSMGGLLVDQDENGNWHNVFDSDEAVDAYYFVARMFLEPFTNAFGSFDTSVYMKTLGALGDEDSYGMDFSYLDTFSFATMDPAKFHFGPVPKGPTGKRGAEFNSRMLGIYAGLENDKPRRDATWEYIRFFDGKEARQIRTRYMVENGYGHYLRPVRLIEAGYPEYVRKVPQGWEEAYQIAVKSGIPEPYGKNCQKVYSYASKAIEQIRTDEDVKTAIYAGDEAAAKARIKEILTGAVKRSDRKMLNIFTPEETRFRNRVAAAVTFATIVAFFFVFRKVFKTFSASQQQITIHVDETRRGEWQFSRYWRAYLLMLPALGLIAVWAYYPLARGSVMAFQDYNVRGFSEWIGMSNIATVIFDPEYWFAMWISLKYALLFMALGFVAPIVLAFLLTEVPKGKVLFRMIYYLPAVLSGVIVIFLWKGFYGTHGLVSEVVNFCRGMLSLLPGIELEPIYKAWLEQPRWALFFSLLPTVWAGMGPGCLIYLAALKTVPDDLYEAADVDGAGFFHKVFHIAIPSIKALIIINFIGAMIAAMKSGGEFMLAMTGGGPYTPYGETEVVGLHIFWEAFAFLRFGTAVSMAWLLGAFLIGFTVIQLQRLSRMEFRTADKVE